MNHVVPTGDTLNELIGVIVPFLRGHEGKGFLRDWMLAKDRVVAHLSMGKAYK